MLQNFLQSLGSGRFLWKFPKSGVPKSRVIKFRTVVPNEHGDLSGYGYGQLVGSCERGNKPSVFHKGEEFLEKVKTFGLLKCESKNSALYFNLYNRHDSYFFLNLHTASIYSFWQCPFLQPPIY
jgi:hypothetical protein